MKKALLIIGLTYSSFSAFSQSHQREYDSLSVLTGKKVLGYSKTYFKNRETLVIFYYDKGEMSDSTVYVKEHRDSAVIRPVQKRR